MQTQFDNFTSEQFVEDPRFIRWVKNGSIEDEAFWQEWIASDPSNFGEFKAAEIWLKAIFTAEYHPEEPGLKEDTWKSIQSSIALKRAKLIPLYTRWLAAASVILILATAIWFWSSNSDNNHGVIASNASKQQATDIAPGGNRATLTLANGNTIILDSAHNGLLSKQGNIQIVKLANGRLAYQKENNTPAPIQYNTITTPRGGQYQLTLADGSQVWLNAASSLTYPTAFIGKERKVQITGEAYFEVAHNAAMPFVVSKGETSIQVLGTHFNVNAYDDEAAMKVTLLEGSVEVKSEKGKVKIVPGEQAVAKVSGELSMANNVDLEEVMAWKNGRFEFKSSALAGIMRQLARWYDVEIVYEAGTAETFSGDIPRTENISRVLKMLELTNTVHFRIEGKKIVVTTK